MLLSKASDVQAWVAKILEQPGQSLHPLLGTPGYRMPATTRLSWVRADTCSITGIEVVKTTAAASSWLLIDPAHPPEEQLWLKFNPGTENNAIIIAGGTKTVGRYSFQGSGNLVVLCNNTLQHSPLYAHFYTSDMLLYWGENSTTNGTHVQLLGDGKRCIVGEDCMFSSGIYIRNSDVHSIIDGLTGEQKNAPTDILVEPHVWVGQDAYIGRKAKLGFASVIGAKSVVAKAIPRWSVAAGVPAKVLSSGTTWDRRPVPQPGTIVRLRELEGRMCSPTGTRADRTVLLTELGAV